jgi:hypothetical protein
VHRYTHIWILLYNTEILDFFIKTLTPFFTGRNIVRNVHMVSLLPTKFHEILFSSFRGVVLTRCFRSIFREMSKLKGAYLPQNSGYRNCLVICYAPMNLNISRNILLKQLVRATPLTLLNRIAWNLVGSKDTICSCAYYQAISISWILWEICPFQLMVSLLPTKFHKILFSSFRGVVLTRCFRSIFREIFKFKGA